MSEDGDSADGCVVRVRGLPWSATADEVLSFFQGNDGTGLYSSKVYIYLLWYIDLSSFRKTAKEGE